MERIKCGVVLLVGLCASGPALCQGTDAEALEQVVGCYAQREQGPASLKVEHRDGKFLLMALGLESPKTPFELVPYPEERFQSMSREMRDVVDVLMTVESAFIGIAKVKKGATIQGMTAESEFLLIAPQVGGPLFPRDCPD